MNTKWVFLGYISLTGLIVTCEAKAGDADCHIFYKGNYGSCGNQVTAADLTVDCSYKNGQPPKQPCLTAAKDWQENCGKCFKMTITEPGSGGLVAGCGPKGCPAYQRTIMIRTIDLSAKADFEVAQNGWSGTHGLCPGVCAHTGYCSESASNCQYGFEPDAPPITSGCYSNTKNIDFVEVECPPKDETVDIDGGDEKESGPCAKDGFFPDPAVCSKYIQCAGGKGYSKSCNSALVWDDSIKNCNFRHSAKMAPGCQ